MDDSNSLEKLDSEMESMGIQSGDDEVETADDDLPFREKSATNGEDWRDVINKVVPAVVVLRVTSCRAFDTDLPSSGHATGFVVDKRRGIILTNRHVVKPGPIVAEAIFVNHEEIPVHPIYRDPVHDFGFFRYDPGAIQFLNYEEIPLVPEAACIGLEIRVVGNDSCEKVSILAGTVARLDRDAPTYKKDGYNDFNTFYIQAASGTKGGSSGSPVIDKKGRAVALNAGSKLSASSSAFFLPLERVVRALRLLQKERDLHLDDWEAVTIPRGTLQATFRHKGFDEIRRLGLQCETEKMVRHTSPVGETGMLVVDSVVPGGPAYMHLEPGDVLVCMNEEVTTKFLKLETFLDDNVNQKIELQIERGGTSLTVKIVVQDLHTITPDHFLEVSGAVIHPLSYQQARNFRFHCGLVYVADPGYMLLRAGVPRHAIIKKIADIEISRLKEFILVLSRLAKGARVPLEYITNKDCHRRKIVLLTLDRHDWYDEPKIYTRNDKSGLWMAKSAIQTEPLQQLSCVDCGYGLKLKGQTSPLCSESSFVEHSHKMNDQALDNNITHVIASHEHDSEETYIGGDFEIKQQAPGDMSGTEIVPADCFSRERNETILTDPSIKADTTLSNNEGAPTPTTNASFAEHVIELSLVMVEVNVPPSCLLDGVHSQHSTGTGVILHHSQDIGLVAVDRNTIAISSSDVMLSFAAFPIEIPGQIVFLHPFYNYAFVAYDPTALGSIGASRVRAAEILPEPALCRGDSVYLVGLRKSVRAISRKSTVTDSCLALNFSSSETPRYRATNIEVIELDSDFGTTFTGVLSNEHGQVQALWACFSVKLKSGGTTSKDHQWVRGIPIYMISQVLDEIISGANGPSLLINGISRPMPLVRVLEVELCTRLLSKARSFGLNDNWIQALAEKDPIRQQVLRVKCCLAGSKAENILKQGDMLLAINKEPITCFRDIENACLALENNKDHDGKLKMTVLRQGHEVDVLVGTNVRDGNGTTRAINWAGCVLQDPHPAVRALGFLPKEGHGVYVAKCFRGSPADRYGLHGLRWIVEVNGKQTPDLDAFVNVTKELDSKEFVRVKTINMHGKPQVLTLKQDLHYWPTWELRFEPETAMWHRDTIKSSLISAIMHERIYDNK